MSILTRTIIDNATRGMQPAPDDQSNTVAVRVTSHHPSKVYAESSFIGVYAPDDAHTIADRIAFRMAGTVHRDGNAIWVEHGERPRLLSMREVADRAGLAESSVRTYRSRGVMPEPDAQIGATPGWLPATIDPWIAELPGRGARTDLQPQ